MAASKRRRPVFFNLIQIQMPVGALTSITHRVTGILLALSVPFSIYLLDLSLQGAAILRTSHTGSFDQWPFEVAAIVFVWALAHHVLAGIRHLLSDIDIGVAVARRAAQRLDREPRWHSRRAARCREYCYEKDLSQDCALGWCSE